MMENNIVYYSVVNKDNIIYNDTSDKLETKLAQIVLKNMLKHFDLKLPKIYLSDSGKPFFKDSKIFFNYSHSKNYIACAISLHEVGIDIEETNISISDTIAKKYLDNEKDNSKRIEIWVKKESYSKLKGLGLQIGFHNIKLDELKEQNFFIKENEYMFSIYCDSEAVVFKELSLSDKLL